MGWLFVCNKYYVQFRQCSVSDMESVCGACLGQMTIEGLLQFMRSMIQLRSLSVAKCIRVNDDFMTGLSQARKLQHLKVSSIFGERLLLPAVLQVEELVAAVDASSRVITCALFLYGVP